MINIVMCTCNGEKHVLEQLKSIAKNSVTDWCLYIADDLSSDRTIEIVRKFADENNVKVHIQVNEHRQGAVKNFLSMAWNLYHTMQDADYIMFCDQDDIWYNDKLFVTLNAMKELEKQYRSDIPLLVSSDVEVVDENLKTIAPSFRKMNRYDIERMDFSHIMMENKVQGCTLMMNKALAGKFHTLPKNAVMHDWWIGLIAAAMGKIRYIDRPTMKYRQHVNNVMGSLAYKDDLKNKVHHLDKQRQIVLDTTEQIAEFLVIYGNELPRHIYRAAEAFATLSKQSFFRRRYSIIKYHMWKSGMLRNIGLLLLI